MGEPGPSEHDLEAAVRRALAGAAPDPVAEPGTRDALVAKLHRRRVRRHTTLGAAAAVVVLVAGLVLVIATGSTSGPPRATGSAAGTTVPRTPPVRPTRPGAGTATSGVTAPFGLSGSAAPGCVTARVGSASPVCFGSPVAPAENAVAGTDQLAQQPTTTTTTQPASAGSNRPPVATSGSAPVGAGSPSFRAAALAVTARPGQPVVLVLPGILPDTWSRPRVSTTDRSEAPSPRVRRDARTGTLTVTVTPAVPGTLTVTVQSVEVCPSPRTATTAPPTAARSAAGTRAPCPGPWQWSGSLVVSR